MRTTLLSIALALGAAGAAGAPCAASLHAQEPAAAPRLALRPYVGTSIPTGVQRDALGDGLLLGGQVGYGLRDHLQLVGDLSWTRPSTKLVSADARTDVYEYDAGLEWDFSPVSTLRPYVALGGGVRDYRYASPLLADGAGGVGFGAVGADFMVGGASLRVEGRDNMVSYAAPMLGSSRATRNDLGLALGVTFHPHGV